VLPAEDEETGESRGLFIEAEHGWPVELRRIANSFLEQQTPPSHVVVDRNGVVVQMNSDYQGRGATRRRRRPRGADGRDTYSRVISTDL
jgi:hypothetical protein